MTELYSTPSSADKLNQSPSKSKNGPQLIGGEIFPGRGSSKKVQKSPSPMVKEDPLE